MNFTQNSVDDVYIIILLYFFCGLSEIHMEYW